MLRKISATIVLSATLLMGGVFEHSVDASASSNQIEDQSHKVNKSTNDQKYSPFTWQKFNRCFYTFKSNQWQQINKQPKQSETVDQPKESEKPKVEVPVENVPTENEAPKQEQQNGSQVEQLSQFEQEVVRLTNEERVNHGLAPLEADAELSRVAREKSRDMAGRNYFDHNSPTYGSPFDMMQSYGITYRTAGENIAKGQRTPQEVVTAWMNSPGHRANILNGNFTHIGSGFYEQGNHWTQMFIGK